MWDVLFGTYYHPRRGEFPTTGVEGTKVETAIGTAIMPFRDWLKLLSKPKVHQL
jgi:sterol desaturase/sphingolipid hydroxylase (fatty acid hydroxylase superfamily)